MSIGFGIPLIGMILISLLDLLLYFSMMLHTKLQDFQQGYDGVYPVPKQTSQGDSSMR